MKAAICYEINKPLVIEDGVTVVKKGDTVVVGTVTSGCGHCYYCTIGKRHYCVERNAFGTPKHKNKKGVPLALMAGPVGGFAEYTTVPQGLVTKTPENM